MSHSAGNVLDFECSASLRSSAEVPNFVARVGPDCRKMCNGIIVRIVTPAVCAGYLGLISRPGTRFEFAGHFKTLLAQSPIERKTNAQ